MLQNLLSCSNFKNELNEGGNFYETFNNEYHKLITLKSTSVQTLTFELCINFWRFQEGIWFVRCSVKLAIYISFLHYSCTFLLILAKLATTHGRSLAVGTTS